MPIDRYQLVLLGPEKAAHESDIIAKVASLFSSMGLDFSTQGQILTDGSLPDWSGFPVGVWFGGGGTADASDLQIMKEFLARGFSLFPVVDQLVGYNAKIPTELHAINGQPWNPARVAGDIMKGFRLARRYRQVFISYRRSESSGVALQLFHSLSERCFHVFLDTASVDAGLDFQKALWSRMADVDLVILLDTPTALDSNWVHQELNRAHDLGLGIVQLIWPGHKQSPGTELSFPVPLGATDFRSARFDQNGTLVDPKVNEILGIIEAERIASLNARRTRLVEGLLEHTKGCGCAVQVHPMRHVDVLKAGSKIAEVIPFVGVPDALALFQQDSEKKHDPTVLVYNGLGVDDEWAKYLKWFNGKAGVTVHQIDDFGIFIGGLV